MYPIYNKVTIVRVYLCCLLVGILHRGRKGRKNIFLLQSHRTTHLIVRQKDSIRECIKKNRNAGVKKVVDQLSGQNKRINDMKNSPL